MRIAYEVAGGGAPLLLVHGLGYDRAGWGAGAELLARRFAVARLDNRGIGESERPPGPYRTADMAADAVTVLDALGCERAHVLGVSLGGMIAQEFALAYPERVDRLVLVSTTPGGTRAFPLPEQTARVFAELPKLPPEVGLRRAVENALAPGSPLVDDVVAYRLAHPPDLDGWRAQAAAGAAHDAHDRLGAIAAPTLVLHGDADVVVDPRNAALLADAITGARLELFAGCGHLLSWEAPERFARAVGDFLEAA